MTTRTIQLSEEIYRPIQERATKLNETPEQLIERMLVSELLVPSVTDDETEELMPASGSPEALAAVERLSMVFANAQLQNIDAMLTDPMLQLANSDLDHLSR